MMLSPFKMDSFKIVFVCKLLQVAIIIMPSVLRDIAVGGASTGNNSKTMENFQNHRTFYTELDSGTEFVGAISKFHELQSCTWISLDKTEGLTTNINGKMQQIRLSTTHNNRNRTKPFLNPNSLQIQRNKFSAFCIVLLMIQLPFNQSMQNLIVLSEIQPNSLISYKNYYSSYILIFDANNSEYNNQKKELTGSNIETSSNKTYFSKSAETIPAYLDGSSSRSSIKYLPETRKNQNQKVMTNFEEHPFKVKIQTTPRNNNYSTSILSPPAARSQVSKNTPLPIKFHDIFPKFLTEDGRGQELLIGTHHPHDCDYVLKISKRRPEGRISILKEFFTVVEIVQRRNFTCRIGGISPITNRLVPWGSPDRNPDISTRVPLIYNYYLNMDISPQLSQDNFGFCYLKGNPEFSRTNISRPLNSQVWLCLACSWLAFALMFALITTTMKLKLNNTVKTNRIHRILHKFRNKTSKSSLVFSELTFKSNRKRSWNAENQAPPTSPLAFPVLFLSTVTSWAWLTFRSLLLQGIPTRNLIQKPAAALKSKLFVKKTKNLVAISIVNSVNPAKNQKPTGGQQNFQKRQEGTENFGKLKLFAGLWFMFIIVMNVSYTSNLISILTSPVDTQDTPENYQDLVASKWKTGSPHLLLLKKFTNNKKNDSFNLVLNNTETFKDERSCLQRVIGVSAAEPSENTGNDTGDNNADSTSTLSSSKFACLGLTEHLRHIGSIYILNLGNVDRFTTVVNPTMSTLKMGLGWKWWLPFRKTFHRVVESIVEGGFPKLWNDEERQNALPPELQGRVLIRKGNTESLGESKKSAIVLGVQHLNGCFAALIFGLFIASWLFFMEHIGICLNACVKTNKSNSNSKSVELELPELMRSTEIDDKDQTKLKLRKIKERISYESQNVTTHVDTVFTF